MKKKSLRVLGLTALALVIALVLSGCGFAAKNLAKQTMDAVKKMAELQEKALVIEEKALALSDRDRRTYQTELERLGVVDAPGWLFNDAEVLLSGAPEETEEVGGILGLIGGLFGGGGGSGSGGTFTLTGIPAQYNGKYAMAMGGDMGKDIAIVGAQTYTRNPVSVTLVPIRGGKVSLNLWTTDSFRQSPYTGNDALSVLVYISDEATGEDINAGEHTIGFDSVTFKNGGATKAWRDGMVGLVSSSTDGGTFTLTGIPAQYNGKYATVMGEDSRKSIALMGAQAITWPTGGEPTTTLAPIRGGRAAMNLWTPTPAGLSPYKGNDTLKVSVGIFDQAVAGPGESPMEEYTVEFANVSFRNGSATQAWRAGTVVESSSSSGSSSSGGTTVPTDSSWKWTRVPTSYGAGYGIYCVAYGGGTFVAGGSGGGIIYSADNGTTWTRIADSTFGRNYITGIAYGGGMFVAGGSGGKMAYSADGQSWTSVSDSKFDTADIRAIAWGNGRFVAGGGGGGIVYSADNGATWTRIADSTFGTSRINGIAYGNNRFVAVGGNGTMAYSADGQSWTSVSDSKFGTSDIRAIAWGNGRFVAVGDGGKMAYSSNGASWTAVADSIFGTSNNDILGIGFGNNRFVAVGDGGKMAYSTDGVTWTAVAVTYNNTWMSGIVYGNGRFVAGSDGRMAYADW